MERLTEYKSFIDASIPGLKCELDEAIKKLAKYEDSLLEPQEVTELYKRIQILTKALKYLAKITCIGNCPSDVGLEYDTETEEEMCDRNFNEDTKDNDCYKCFIETAIQKAQKDYSKKSVDFQKYFQGDWECQIQKEKLENT